MNSRFQFEFFDDLQVFRNPLKYLESQEDVNTLKGLKRNNSRNLDEKRWVGCTGGVPRKPKLTEAWFWRTGGAPLKASVDCN